MALSPSSMSGPAVTGPTPFDDHMLDMRPYFFSFWCEQNFKSRGSISAEHGLGFKKRNFIHFSKSESAVFLMKQIKQARKYKIKNSFKLTNSGLQVFDPKGIMNPYKVLPDQ